MKQLQRKSICLALSLGVLVAVPQMGLAQVQADDLLVNYFGSGIPPFEHLQDDGMLVASGAASTNYYEGIAVTASGKFASTSRLPNTLHLFDSNGVETSTFPLPTISTVAGDVDVFADGTLAIVDRGGSVELYDESGVHQGSISHPQMDSLSGCHIDSNDHLWITDLNSAVPLGGWIYKFDRQGNALQFIFTSTFEPADLVSDHDGTIWVCGYRDSTVYHMDAGGTILSSFPSGLGGFFTGIALHWDGTLYLSAHDIYEIRMFTKAGVQVGNIPLAAFHSPLFLRIRDGADVSGRPYCFGDGSGIACPCLNPGAGLEGCANSSGVGAVLRASGLNSVSTDAKSFSASGLLPNQPALLFAGLNAVQNGNGAGFGDGLRCAGGSVARLGVSSANANGTASWGPGLAASGGWSSGDTRRFQVWYRDPTGSPCGSGFNLSNGVEVVFTP